MLVKMAELRSRLPEHLTVLLSEMAQGLKRFLFVHLRSQKFQASFLQLHDFQVFSELLLQQVLLQGFMVYTVVDLVDFLPKVPGLIAEQPFQVFNDLLLESRVILSLEFALGLPQTAVA